VTPAAEEAKQIAGLVPNPYTDGHYYPVEYNGRSIQIAVKHGRGNQAGKRYLHVLSPCKTVIKTPAGEVLSRYDDFRHHSIRLSDPAARWTQH